MISSWRRASSLLIAAALLVVGWTTLGQLRLSDTDFFRDLGRVLTRATTDRAADGSESRRFVVCTHFHSRMMYYVDSELCWPHPITIPDQIESHRAGLRDQLGIRFLWLDFRDATGEPIREIGTSASMDRYLAGFPRQRVASLERSFRLPPDGRLVELHRAFVVTVEP